MGRVVADANPSGQPVKLTVTRTESVLAPEWSVTQADGHQARAQTILRRLAHTQVGGQREGSDDLGQAYLSAVAVYLSPLRLSVMCLPLLHLSALPRSR